MEDATMLFRHSLILLTIVACCSGQTCYKKEGSIWWTSGTEQKPRSSPVDQCKISLYRPDNDLNFENFEFEGQKYTIRKLASRPLLYEIDDLLSEKEVETILAKAESNGFGRASTLHVDLDEMWKGDYDHDGKYNMSEMRAMMEVTYYAYVLEHHLRDMYQHFGLDEDGDGIVSNEELDTRFPEGYAPVSRYIHTLMENEPTVNARISETAWLRPNHELDHPVLGPMIRRVASLTKLPLVMVGKSDLQIARYGPGGYYNVHMDSTEVDPNVPCSTLYYRKTPNRQCRFATLLMYLSNVEEGGETAFPVADMPQDYENYRFRLFSGSNLNEHCYDSNVIVKPKRGKAVLWYNHMVNSDGWLGANDDSSEHGGCPVRRGVKTIANFWLLTTDDRDADLTPWTGNEEMVF